VRKSPSETVDEGRSCADGLGVPLRAAILKPPLHEV
jgi:hypothetical protein